jgi:hypothetical protein
MEMTRMEKKRKMMHNGRLVSVFVSPFVRIAHTQLVIKVGQHMNSPHPACLSSCLLVSCTFCCTRKKASGTRKKASVSFHSTYSRSEHTLQYALYKYALQHSI